MTSSPSDPEVRAPSAVALDLASDLMECSKLADSARQIQDALDAAHEAGWRKGVEEAERVIAERAKAWEGSGNPWEAHRAEMDAAAIRALRDRGPAEQGGE